MKIRALDAAQTFDYESIASKSNSHLKIAIVGFGNFGQFLAKTFASQGHTLLAHSRSDYSQVARSLNTQFFHDPHDLCEQHPDVVLISTSILSFSSVLNSIPFYSLKRDTLFADCLSVKEYPKNMFLNKLPKHFDILCTHPMFGPESGKNGWKDLPFVYEKVRVGDSENKAERVKKFLDCFEMEGCRMVEMSCEEHDEHASDTQFLTHTVGRMLGLLDLKDTPINTKGYDTLRQLKENCCKDSFELYNGLFMYNKNATQLFEKLDTALNLLRKDLFENLHDVKRKQLFE